METAAIKYPDAKPIAFIDERIDGWQAPCVQLAGMIDTVVLDAASDGVEQILKALARYDRLSAIHPYSRGSEAALSLGASEINGDDGRQFLGRLADLTGAAWRRRT
ncbi:DUF4347 domain-containing protein [Methylomonas sp. CM2]|uniref:DUF4347 domain-containing protein n=1 Tax=Methylomonas sp. CM2 TaxID=3417647 RepID=UPI003CF2F55C